MKFNAKFYVSVTFWLEVVATIFAATQLGVGRFNFAWWEFLFSLCWVSGEFLTVFFQSLDVISRNERIQCAFN